MRLSHQRHDRSAASRDARANCGRNGASSGASACFAKLPHLREGEPRGPVRGVVKRSMEAMGGLRRVLVNKRAAEVTKDGQPVDLTAREFQLLVYFIEHEGATRSRDELLNALWGYESTVLTRTVGRTRGQASAEARTPSAQVSPLLNLHGPGYRFVG